MKQVVKREALSSHHKTTPKNAPPAQRTPCPHPGNTTSRAHHDNSTPTNMPTEELHQENITTPTTPTTRREAETERSEVLRSPSRSRLPPHISATALARGARIFSRRAARVADSRNQLGRVIRRNSYPLCVCLSNWALCLSHRQFIRRCFHVQGMVQRALVWSVLLVECVSFEGFGAAVLQMEFHDIFDSLADEQPSDRSVQERHVNTRLLVTLDTPASSGRLTKTPVANVPR